jgi:3-methyladenine DNA glycosylase Tag
MRAERYALTLTIRYHHRNRPNEAGVTMITAQETAAAMVAQLEKRGFVVEKITARSSFAETMADTDPS